MAEDLLQRGGSGLISKGRQRRYGRAVSEARDRRNFSEDTWMKDGLGIDRAVGQFPCLGGRGIEQRSDKRGVQVKMRRCCDICKGLEHGLSLRDIVRNARSRYVPLRKRRHVESCHDTEVVASTLEGFVKVFVRMPVGVYHRPIAKYHLLSSRSATFADNGASRKS